MSKTRIVLITILATIAFVILGQGARAWYIHSRISEPSGNFFTEYECEDWDKTLRWSSDSWSLTGTGWTCDKKVKIVTKVEKKVIELQPVVYNGMQIRGDCALVDPPCFEDIGTHNVIRLRKDDE